MQLTWERNYRAMDKALNLNGADSLLIYPDNVLDGNTAYKIMSYGMRNGTFTGKKLADYIAGANADYRNARKIINGLDKADLIKRYAQNIKFLLRFCSQYFSWQQLFSYETNPASLLKLMPN